MDTKATGWVPDYPDVKDYTLDKVKDIASRVQRDQTTGSIEDLAEKIKKALDILAQKYTGNENKELTQLSEEIENKIFGEFTFKTATLQKTLSLGMSDWEVPSLKSSFLLQTKYKELICQRLPGVRSENKQKNTKNIFTKFEERALQEWMLQPKFDEYTQEVVEDIQKRYKSKYELLEVNGIVDDITREAIRQDRAKQRYWEWKVEDDNVEPSQIHLDPNWDWIEEEVFIEEILNTQKNKKQSKVTVETVNEVLSKYKEEKTGIKAWNPKNIAEFAEKYYEDMDDFLESARYLYLGIPVPIPDQVYVGIFKLLKLKLNASNQDNTPDSEQIQYELFAKAKLLIYPIAEVIVRIISPIGTSRNLKEDVRKGLNCFEALVRGDAKKDCPEYFQEIALEALDQVKQNIDAEKKAQEDQPRSLEVDKPSLLELSKPALLELENYINNLKELEDKSKKSKEKRTNSKNYYPRKELIKLAQKENEGEESESCFLQIPISNSLDKEIKKQKEYNQKRDKKSEEECPEAQHSSEKVYLSLPKFVDLSLWCSPVENQGTLNSCTAHAGIALTEYFEKKRFGKHVDASPLFLYKVARNLMHSKEDTGASIRETMRAMVLFGIAPEEYWPYQEDKVNAEPTPFCYSFAQSYQAIKYFRLDHEGISKPALLAQIKTILVAGFPCMFGFSLYSSIYNLDNAKGHIPYPTNVDKIEGGHAVVAVGYDNSKIIENSDGTQTEGALLIRNSWGSDWGEGGYGWLPYEYVLTGLTADWWSLLKSEWIETGEFGLGAKQWTSNVGTPIKGGGRNP